jgi:hypothetical protein
MDKTDATAYNAQALFGPTVDDLFLIRPSSFPVDELRNMITLLIQEGKIAGLRGPQRLLEVLRAALREDDETVAHVQHYDEMKALGEVASQAAEKPATR